MFGEDSKALFSIMKKEEMNAIPSASETVHPLKETTGTFQKKTSFLPMSSGVESSSGVSTGGSTKDEGERKVRSREDVTGREMRRERETPCGGTFFRGGATFMRSKHMVARRRMLRVISEREQRLNVIAYDSGEEIDSDVEVISESDLDEDKWTKVDTSDTYILSHSSGEEI